MTSATALAVFGGTFDPVHNGHVASALAVSRLLGGAEVVMAPCQLPPHRNAPGATAEERLAMLQLAVKGLDKVSVDARELFREGPSFTYDTLKSVREETGSCRPVVFALGSDAYKTLPSWHRWRDIITLCHLLVLSRPDDNTAPGDTLCAWERERLTGDAADLLREPAGRVCAVKLTQVNVSATSIRASIARGESIKGKVPGAVADYIQTHRLYMRDVSAAAVE